MKFGLFYLPTYLPETRDAHTHYHNMVEQVVYADRIGIDYAWMVEHHFVRHGGLLPANYAFLSYLAGRTERIRLGTGATILPLNDPVRVAEQAAALDQLSKGRFDFGVGRGFIRDEFDAFGVPMKESRERVEQGVGLIRKAWCEPTLEFDGSFPARDVRPSDPSAGVPEAAPADLGRLPAVTGELRMGPPGRATTSFTSPITSTTTSRSSASAGTATLCGKRDAGSRTTRSAAFTTPISSPRATTKGWKRRSTDR